jgi:hypothetical protein
MWPRVECRTAPLHAETAGRRPCWHIGMLTNADPDRHLCGLEGCLARLPIAMPRWDHVITCLSPRSHISWQSHHMLIYKGSSFRYSWGLQVQNRDSPRLKASTHCMGPSYHVSSKLRHVALRNGHDIRRHATAHMGPSMSSCMKTVSKQAILINICRCVCGSATLIDVLAIYMPICGLVPC